MSKDYAWAMPSQHAKDRLGTEITWTKGTREVIGICIGVEIVPGVTIINVAADTSWPAVRFLIRPHDGSRNVWTSEFADRPEADGSS